MALLVIGLMVMMGRANAADLTPADIQLLLSSAGVNPGTVKMFEGKGRFALRSVLVGVGSKRGEYLIRFQVEQLPD